jgi:hypothetical protein
MAAGVVLALDDALAEKGLTYDGQPDAGGEGG